MIPTNRKEIVMPDTWLIIFLVGGVVFFLGILLGNTMTVHLMGARGRRQDAFQRKLNAQWQVIQDARHQLVEQNNREWLLREEPPLFVDGDVAVVTDRRMVRM